MEKFNLKELIELADSIEAPVRYNVYISETIAHTKEFKDMRCEIDSMNHDFACPYYILPDEYMPIDKKTGKKSHAFRFPIDRPEVEHDLLHVMNDKTFYVDIWAGNKP